MIAHNVRISGSQCIPPRWTHSWPAGCTVLGKATLRGRILTMLQALGFEQATCGCIFARYRCLSTDHELLYVEAPGTGCVQHRGTVPFEHVSTDSAPVGRVTLRSLSSPS